MALLASGVSTSTLQQHSNLASSSRQLRVSAPCLSVSLRVLPHPNRLRCLSSAAGSLGGATPNPDQPRERTYTPFPRLRESDPYRLLGLSKDAEFEEVVYARNFLFEDYRWHEPSREAIELAFDSIMQEKLKQRNKSGFRAGSNGKGRRAEPSNVNPSLSRKISNLFDPTVTFRTLINEGLVFVGLALWALYSTDQSFSLAGAFAYSVYKLQSKRLKTNPEGPFLGNNPMIGALITTLGSLALGCGIMALAAAPLGNMVEGSLRQLGGFVVIITMGVLSVYLK